MHCLRFLALFSIILFTITIAIAAPKGQLKGQLKDESGQPVRAATIALSARDGRQLITTTSAEGNFSFNDLKSGDYLIKADASGFRAQVEEIKLAEGEIR